MTKITAPVEGFDGLVAGAQFIKGVAEVPEDFEHIRYFVEAGYEVGGEQLVTRPRGVAADAPRLDLLRRKALTVSLKLGAPDWLATPEAAEYLNDGWDEVRPLVEWLVEYVGESETQSRR